MTAYPNRFAGTCHRCQADVAAGAGHCFKQDGRWLVSCRTACEERPPVPRQQPPARPTQEIGDLAGIMRLFDKARTHLQSPAIELGVADLTRKTPDGKPVQLPAIRVNVAGERAKVPGSLTVLSADTFDRGGEYPERDWFGRILIAGTFEPTRELRERPDYLAAVIARLQAFAADPSKVGGDDGRLHGRCCFCRKALTREESTGAGYGKKCASNWGLPWGAKPAEFAGPATVARRRHARPMRDDELSDNGPGEDLTGDRIDDLFNVA